MLEKYRLSNADTSSIYRPDFMAAIVFPRVPEIEPGDGVFIPSFSFGGHHMEFDCAAQWRPQISVEIVLTIQYFERRFGGVHP